MRRATWRLRGWAGCGALVACLLAADPAAALPADASTWLQGGTGSPFTPLGSPTAKKRPSLKPRIDRDTVLVAFAHGASADARARAVARVQGRLSGHVRRTRFDVVSVAGRRAGDVVAELRRDRSVAVAQPNFIRTADAAPNDRLYVKGRQGWLDTLRMPLAWDRSKATSSERVAVLDTGVDLDNPELAPQLADGYDFVNGDTTPSDDEGHGTAVAGIAAARTNEGEGIAGVSWGGGILPVKVLDSAGEGLDSDVAAGITWAADHGASVINMSLGGPGASPVLADAVAYARAQGAVLVAAAGNTSASTPNFPAATPGVLAVSATDWDGNLTYFSSWGNDIDLAAPGRHMLAPARTPGAKTAHEIVDGTSFASPVVAGIALLVRHQDPSLTPDQVDARLMSTALDAGPPGRDDFYGSGVVDPVAALGGTRAPPVLSPAGDGDDTPNRARVISNYATPTVSTLDRNGDVDWFAVDLPHGGEYILTVRPSISSYYAEDRAEQLDAVVRVYDSNLQPREYLDGSGADQQEGGYIWADHADRRYIRISNYNGSRATGPYTLTFFANTAPVTTPAPKFDTSLVDSVHSPPNAEPRASAVGDVTGDGHPDVLMTSYYADDLDHAFELYVYPGDPDDLLHEPQKIELGTFEQYVSGTPVHGFEMQVATGDIDGDGRTDAVVAAGRALLVLYQRNGFLSAPVAVPDSSYAESVRVADLNRDGRLDLITGRARPEGPGVFAFLNQGGGTFAEERVTDGGADDVKVGDVNRDNRLDVVALGDRGLHVWRQRSDGSFDDEGLGVAPSAFAVGDLNDDGIDDVALAIEAYQPGGPATLVYPGTTGAQMGPARTYATDYAAAAMDAADVDGDGRTDLLMAVSESWCMCVWLQQPDGSLKELRLEMQHPSYEKSGAIGIGDITGDGAPDITVADETWGVWLFTERTAGSPAPPAILDTTPYEAQRNVSTTAAPSIKLGRAADPATISASTVKLATQAGTSVAVTTAYDSASRTVSVRPASSLAPATGYVLRFDGVRDIHGAHLGLALDFTTSGAADSRPPDTRFLSGPRGTDNQTSVHFIAYADEPGTSFQCSLDGTAFTACAAPLEVHDLGLGTHTYRVRAVDAAGNVDPTPASRTWTFESINSPANDWYWNAQAISGASGTLNGSNAAATDWGANGPMTASNGGLASVWYRWQSPGTGWLTVDTAGSTFDTVVGAYSGANAGDAVRLGDNDDAPDLSGGASRVRIWVGAGDYYLGVAGFSDDLYGDNGRFVLNWSFTPATDDTAPDTSITDAPPAIVNDTHVVVHFASSEDDSSFECQLDAEGWRACESPRALFTPDGAHVFRVRARDPASNTDATPAEASWQTDATAPETSFTSYPPESTSSTDATFGFMSPRGDATFECRLDHGDFTPCTSPKRYTGLDRGGHRLQVRAVAPNGHVDDTPATAYWAVVTPDPDDRTPPQTVLDGPGDGSWRNTGFVGFFLYASEGLATFECKLDDGAWTPCSSNPTYSGLADGRHTFEARATDVSGNTDPTPSTTWWMVDTTPPETSIDSGPSDPTIATNGTAPATFVFSSTEGTGYVCRLDGGDWNECSSPVTFPSVPIGPHTFEVKARDTAWNYDATPATWTWTVRTAGGDTQPPDTHLLSGPSGSVRTTSGTFTFDATEQGTFQCSLDAAPFSACNSPYAFSFLSEGAHTFRVRAIDGSGNTDPTPAQATWTVDLTKPDTTITDGPAGSTQSTDATFRFSSESGATFSCQLDGGSWSPCSPPTEYSGLAPGSHTFKVVATDAAGNVDDTPAVRTWSVVEPPPPTPDTTAPDTTITSQPPALSNAHEVTVEFTSTEAGTFECRFDEAAWSTCMSPTTLNGMTDGDHAFRVRAIDSAGNVDASPAVAAWRLDTIAPETTITSGPTGDTTTGRPQFGFQANEDGTTFECRVDSDPFLPCLSPYTTAALTIGDHAFNVRAIDAAGNADPAPAERKFRIVSGAMGALPPGSADDGGVLGETLVSDTHLELTRVILSRDRIGVLPGHWPTLTLRFSSTLRTSVTVLIEKDTIGALRNGTCSAHGSRGKRCHLWTRTPGSFGVSARAGANAVTFGRNSRHLKLRRGRYRFVLVAGTGSAAVVKRSAAFRILAVKAS